MEYYVQCRFIKRSFIGIMSAREQKILGGDRHTIAWIPEHAAKVGNQVQLLSLDGDFWEVAGVGSVRKPKEEVKEDERAYKDFQESLKGGGIDQ
jgi:hypothetical protein